MPFVQPSGQEAESYSAFRLPGGSESDGARPAKGAVEPQKQASDRDMTTPASGTAGAMPCRPLIPGQLGLREGNRAIARARGGPRRVLGRVLAGSSGLEVSSLRAAACAAVAELVAADPSASKGEAAGPRRQPSSASPRAAGDRALSHRAPGAQQQAKGPQQGPRAGQAAGKPDPGRAASGVSTESASGTAQAQACPPHGAKAICGRRPRMEDAYTAIPFLLEVLVPADVLGHTTDILPPRIATHVRSANSSPGSSVSDQGDAPSQERPRVADTHVDSNMSASTTVSASGQDDTIGGSSAAGAGISNYVETLHFFGVFDGHGGAEGALHCAQTLHQRIVEAVVAHTSPEGTEVCSFGAAPVRHAAALNSCE